MARPPLPEMRDMEGDLEEAFGGTVASLLDELNQRLLEAHTRAAARQEREAKFLRAENQELRRRLGLGLAQSLALPRCTSRVGAGLPATLDVATSSRDSDGGPAGFAESSLASAPSSAAVSSRPPKCTTGIGGSLPKATSEHVAPQRRAGLPSSLSHPVLPESFEQPSSGAAYPEVAAKLHEVTFSETLQEVTAKPHVRTALRHSEMSERSQGEALLDSRGNEQPKGTIASWDQHGGDDVDAISRDLARKGESVASGDQHADDHLDARSRRLARMAQQLQATNERKSQEIEALRALLPGKSSSSIDTTLSHDRRTPERHPSHNGPVHSLTPSPTPSVASFGRNEATPPLSEQAAHAGGSMYVSDRDQWLRADGCHSSDASSSLPPHSVTPHPCDVRAASNTLQHGAHSVKFEGDESEDEKELRVRRDAAEEARRAAKARKELAELTRRENAERRKAFEEDSGLTEIRKRQTLSSLDFRTSTRKNPMYQDMLDKFDGSTI